METSTICMGGGGCVNLLSNTVLQENTHDS